VKSYGTLVNQSWDWDRRGQEASGRRAVEAAGDEEDEEEQDSAGEPVPPQD